MESMASGLPVVASNIRGNSDLVEDGKCGYLIEPKDSEGFSKRIKELSINKTLRIQLSTNNTIKADKYSINNIIKNMKKIYLDNES